MPRLTFLQGYSDGKIKFEMPSARLSIEFLKLSSLFCTCLKWHTDSIFQFVVAPADAMRKYNPNMIKTVNVSVYSASFREMKDVYPFDMKNWVYGRGKVFSWLIIFSLVVLLFLKSFLSEIKNVKFKQSLSIGNPKKVLLIRKPVQNKQRDNIFYKSVFADHTVVYLGADEPPISSHQVDMSVKMFLGACKFWILSLIEALTSVNCFQVNGVLYKFSVAKWEALANFSSFAYAQKLLAIKECLDKNECQISSFEQVSWSAAIEKSVFESFDFRHIQIGILPYFPYPTLGLHAPFYFRSSKILNQFKEKFPSRSFEALNVHLDGDLSKALLKMQAVDFKFVFATQPYRKDQELQLINLLTSRYGSKLFVRYHPRDAKIYKNKESNDLTQNVIVITRCSSIVLECFANGVPFVSYIDHQDKVLDQNELMEDGAPAFVAEIENIFACLDDVES